MKKIVILLILLFLLYSNSHAANVFTAGDDGVIAFWDFEDDATDSVGAYDMTNNGVAYSTSGVSTGSKSGAFVGSENDNFRILDADMDEYIPGDSSWTPADFSFAVVYTPTDGTPSVTGGIINKYLSGTDKAYTLIHRNTGELELWTGNSDANASMVVETGSALSDGDTYSIVVTYEHSTKYCTLSVYNVTDSTSHDEDVDVTATDAVGPTDEGLYIGRLNESTSNDITGYVDSVVFWNRELTATEIDEIHAGTYGAGAWTGHSRGNYSSIPTDADPLETQFSGTDDTNVATDNDTYVTQDAETTDVYAVFQFKEEQSDSSLYIYPTIQLKSQEAPSSHTVTLSIWDAQTDTAWDSKATDSATAADTEFYLTPQITTGMSDYVDNDNYINFMVYQQGDNEDTVSVDWWKTDYGIAGVDDVTWVEAQATGSSIMFMMDHFNGGTIQ